MGSLDFLVSGACDELEELIEVDLSGVIGVYVVQDSADLLLGQVVSKGLHGGGELLGGDRSRSVFVKEVEGLLVLCGFLGGEVLAHFGYIINVANFGKKLWGLNF